MGEKFASEHMQQHFTFFTNLVLNLSTDTANITEAFISRLMPHIGNALQSVLFFCVDIFASTAFCSSKVIDYKLSGMMIVTDLCLHVTLSDDIIEQFLKLLMMVRSLINRLNQKQRI